MSELPVLLADDDLESIEALRGSIQEAGHPVRTATSLAEIQSALETEALGVLLVTGGRLLHELSPKLTDFFSDVEYPPELLLIVEESDLEVATSLLERHTGDHLVRPFTSNQLMSSIETGQVRITIRRERVELEDRLDDVRRRFDEASERQTQLVKSIDQRRDRILDRLDEENSELRAKLQDAVQEGTREAAERLSLVEDRLNDTQKECDRLHQECDRLTEQLKVERLDHNQMLAEVQRDAAEAHRLLEETQRNIERQRADFESKANSLREQTSLDLREHGNQIRHLEETRVAHEAQIEDLLAELTQARDARKEAEEDRRKLKDELLEKVGELTERLELRDSEAGSIERRHEDLERAHAELLETSQSRTVQLEDELDALRISSREYKESADLVRVRLEKHLEAKNSELRSMAEERSVLRGRIKGLDEDLRQFSSEVASKEEERDSLIRELESRARRAEKEAREFDATRKRNEERHRTEVQNFERKLADREREAQRLSRENSRLAEYLRTERANLSTRLEASERRIQSLMAAKNMLNDEFGKRLEDQAGRLERLTREHERIAEEHRSVVERLEAKVASLKESLTQRESELETAVLERERFERLVSEKDRLVGQLTIEARELRGMLGRENAGDDLVPPESVDVSEEIEPDPGVSLEARGKPLGAVITEAEYEALSGGWGDLTEGFEEAAPLPDQSVPPGFETAPGADSLGAAPDASGETPPKSALPPGFSPLEEDQ